MREDEDDRLVEIAAALGEDELEDPRLLSLVRGELSPEAQLSLEQEAQHDPGLAEAVEMLAPLSKTLEDTLVESAVRSARGPARPLRAWGRAALAVGAAGAMAAGLAVWVGGTAGLGDLPDYRLEVASLTSEYRGAAEPAGVGGDDRVEVVLRPEVEVSGRVEASLFVSEDDGAFRAARTVQPAIERGAVRWVGPVKDLAPRATRRVQLLAIVGRPGASPTLEVAVRNRVGRGWRSVRADLAIKIGAAETEGATEAGRRK